MTTTTPQNTSEYMLLFKNNGWLDPLSPEEKQQVSTRWMKWVEGLSKDGVLVSGRPLATEGKIIAGKGGMLDGPYVESKESIGGFFLLKVASLNDAEAIAHQCPGLPYGAVLELRAIADACPMELSLKKS